MNDEFKQRHQTNLDKPVTMGVLLEYTDEFLLPKFKKLTGEALSGHTDEFLLPKIKEQTMGMMLEYTDEFLVPKFSELMDDKIRESNVKLEYNLKSYFDEKLADHTAEMFSRFDKKWEKDRDFRKKVVELFKQHQIGSATDIAFLEGLVAGN